MIELGQLEAQHAEFAKRNARVVVASLEGPEVAKATQKEFPHLVVVADSRRKLAEAVEVIHRQSAPDGGDTSAPTTLVVDGKGTVRWMFRPDRFLTRLTAADVLAALDEHLPNQ
jgi:peroxiredoxin